MKWVGLNEKNYWKRIQAIRERDLQLTISEQCPEAHAFLYKRTEEKFHFLEVMTMEIVESKSANARDRLSAMEFLRQLYEDEYSLFMFGPFQAINFGPPSTFQIIMTGGFLPGSSVSATTSSPCAVTLAPQGCL